MLHIRLNSGPLIALSQAGLLKEGDVFVHCTHLNKDAWRVIHDTGARTSHSPVVEMAMEQKARMITLEVRVSKTTSCPGIYRLPLDAGFFENRAPRNSSAFG